MAVESQKGSGKGCLFYGCLSLVVLVIVLLVGGYLTTRYVVNTAIANFTDDSPLVFEEIVLTDQQREDLRARVKAFTDAQGRTNQPVELSLTSDEINTLITENKSDHVLADKVRINMEDDKLVARASIPLEQFAGLPFLGRLEGRYLNANVNLGIALRQGVVDLSILSAEVNGQPLPDEVLAEIEKEMSVQDMMNDPEIRKYLDKLDSIRIENGRLRVSTGGSP